MTLILASQSASRRAMLDAAGVEYRAVPAHLDDPELIGFWTLDEFLSIILPFAWGILSQHILIGISASVLAWWGLRKLKAGRAVSWIIHSAYWYLPGAFMGLKATPPSHLRLMAG